MPTWRVLSCLLLTAALAVRPADAAPAQFWLSLDDSSSGPSVVNGYAVDDTPLEVHVWARPQTVGSTTLQNFSLNVVSKSTDFDVDAGSITVYNPVYDSALPRFEFVSDSADGFVDVDANLPVTYHRGIAGVQGFTIDSATAEGFGGGCNAKDPYCDDSSGTEAWLVASFTMTPNTTGASAELFLQVGLNGISHTGEGPADMEVVFGVDSDGAAPPNYDPSTDQQWTHGDDDPDAVLLLLKAGDYDTDGDVDANDYTTWRDAYDGANFAADGNSDRVIDAADYTVWRDNLPPAPGPSAASPTPAPPASCLLLTAGIAVRRRRAAR